MEESQPLRDLCRDKDFSLIQLVTPTTPPDRAKRIADSSSGFLYVVSVTGITGQRKELPEGLVDRVSWLREQTELPVCIGFGISSPEHVRMLAPCGRHHRRSAVVRYLETSNEGEAVALESWMFFVRELLSALSH